jgi:hypothetical protein
MYPPVIVMQLVLLCIYDDCRGKDLAVNSVR